MIDRYSDASRERLILAKNMANGGLISGLLSVTLLRVIPTHWTRFAIVFGFMLLWEGFWHWLAMRGLRKDMSRSEREFNESLNESISNIRNLHEKLTVPRERVANEAEKNRWS